jgi:hypothetical protein
VSSFDLVNMRVFLLLCLILSRALALELFDVESSNFELTLSSNDYVAMLFYDDSMLGRALKKNWESAANRLHRTLTPDDSSESSEPQHFLLDGNSEMALIDGTDANLAEVIEMYGIEIPSIKVFRKGVLHEYRGPILRGAEGATGDVATQIALYLSTDSLPSVTTLDTVEGVKEMVRSSSLDVPMILGFFDDADIEADYSVEGGEDGYDMSPWGQYQAAADALRGHAAFYLLLTQEVREAFNVDSDSTALPVVYMLSDDKEKLLPYGRDIMENKLSEWVLRNASPRMDRLHLNNAQGELYATQFFSSSRLKFILFVTSDQASASVSKEEEETEDETEEKGATLLDMWGALATAYKGKAVFAYMVGADVPDVLEYFSVDVTRDLPLVVAHDPFKDAKYKSGSSGGDMLSLEDMHTFVMGVVEGKIDRTLKSAVAPPEPSDESIWSGKDGDGAAATKDASLPQVLVGSNVVAKIGTPNRDILLFLHRGAAHKYKAEAELLARAVAAEPRIIIAKIDLDSNDVPSAWESAAGEVPGLLWFPAKDKVYNPDSGVDGGSSRVSRVVPTPRKYWQAGFSLQEMLAFVQRQSSYDTASLRVASQEQLGMLLQELDGLTLQYDDDMRVSKRNEGRPYYEDWLLDYFLGEIVYDGKRVHVLGLCVVLVLWLYSLYAVHALSSSSSSSSGGGGRKTARAGKQLKAE